MLDLRQLSPLPSGIKQIPVFCRGGAKDRFQIVVFNCRVNLKRAEIQQVLHRRVGIRPFGDDVELKAMGNPGAAFSINNAAEIEFRFFGLANHADDPVWKSVIEFPPRPEAALQFDFSCISSSFRRRHWKLLSQSPFATIRFDRDSAVDT